MLLANAHPEVVTGYIQKELRLGQIWAPFSPWIISHHFISIDLELHVSRRVTTLGNGGWSQISPSHKDIVWMTGSTHPSVCYHTQLWMISLAMVVAQTGQGSSPRQGGYWISLLLNPSTSTGAPTASRDSNIYTDPFGLGSALKVFKAVADALHWYQESHWSINVVIGQPHSPQWAQSLVILDDVYMLHSKHPNGQPQTWRAVNMPNNPWHWNSTVSGQLHLPADKLNRLCSLLHDWGDKKACSRKKLQSLIGLLNHASEVVRSGRAFLLTFS